jgi:hypothetical protein
MGRHLWVLGFCLLTTVPALSQGRVTIALPVDPEAVVMALEYRGGFGGSRNTEPYLAVRGNGRVTATSYGKSVDMEVPAAELQELLHFAIEDQQFFEFTIAAAEQELREQPGCRIRIDDAGTTIISVTTRERQGTASFDALSFHSRMYPSARWVGRLSLIEQRLDTLFRLAMGGGREAVEAAVRDVREFANSRPEVPTVALEDYQRTVYPGLLGQKTMQFVRDSTRVTVTYSADGQAAVSTETIQAEEDLIGYLKDLSKNRCSDGPGRP